MSFPDYGPAIEQLGAWIAAGINAEPGKNLFLEPSIPQAPDAVQAIFEIGGDWDAAACSQHWRLSLVTRAATLTEARALATKTINALLDGFKNASVSERGIIRNLTIDSLPNLQPRDDRGRVLIETRLVMLVSAPSEFDDQ